MTVLMISFKGSPDHESLQLLLHQTGAGFGALSPGGQGAAPLGYRGLQVEFSQGALELGEGVDLETVRGALNVPHMKNHTGVLLRHTDQAEVARRGTREGEETDEGLVLEQDEGAPGLEVVEEFGGGDAALDGGEAAAGRGGQEVAGQEGVLLEDEDDLVGVEPAVPVAGVHGDER